MSDSMKIYGLLGIKLFLAAIFLTTGGGKLIGTEVMVATFERIGYGQWFRIVTGVIECAGALLLFLPGWQARGAGLLLCTMIGAVIAHVAILGPSVVPAVVLGVLAAVVLYAHKDQMAP